MLLLGGAIWLWRRGRGERIASPEDAVDAAERALAGFRAVNAVLSADGAAALVMSGDRRIAVCRRRGARVAVREVSWNAIRATAGGLVVDTGDRRSGRIAVAGVDALDVRRLAASAGAPGRSAPVRGDTA